MYPQEKQLIREAFHRCYPDLLPKEVLFRKKEAFSDGVSSTKNSWFVMLQNHISSLSSQSGSNNESSYYLSVFAQQFNKNGYCYDHVIPHYWMPNFSNAKDPSARVLEVYEEETGDK
jgi:asparagine synthase (glutamine-hydrolysing)